MTAFFLAMLGWNATTVDGVQVWVHASGLVIYNQSAYNEGKTHG